MPALKHRTKPDHARAGLTVAVGFELALLRGAITDLSPYMAPRLAPPQGLSFPGCFESPGRTATPSPRSRPLAWNLTAMALGGVRKLPPPPSRGPLPVGRRVAAGSGRAPLHLLFLLRPAPPQRAPPRPSEPRLHPSGPRLPSPSEPRLPRRSGPDFPAAAERTREAARKTRTGRTGPGRLCTPEALAGEQGKEGPRSRRVAGRDMAGGVLKVG